MRHQLKRNKFRTILFSHHQALSAFVNEPTVDCNARLLDQIFGGGGSSKPITAWFHGHEHHGAVLLPSEVHKAFPATQSVQYFECAGNGAIPSTMEECTPQTPAGLAMCDPRFLPTAPEDINQSAVAPSFRKPGHVSGPIVKSGFVILDVLPHTIKVTHFYVNGTKDPTAVQKGPVLHLPAEAGAEGAPKN